MAGLQQCVLYRVLHLRRRQPVAQQADLRKRSPLDFIDGVEVAQDQNWLHSLEQVVNMGSGVRVT